MQLLIALAVLVVLSGPVALVVAIVTFVRTRRLERAILAREFGASVAAPLAAASSATTSATLPSAAVTAGRTPPPVPPGGVPQSDVPQGDVPQGGGPQSGVPPGGVPRSSVPRSGRSRDLEARIGGEWLTWIGVLAIFFGTAFFLAVRLGTHPLAGAGQVWVGLGVATAFLAVGTIVSGRSTLFLGPGLLGGGTALVFLSIFAATVFHRILGTTTAYLLLAGAALFGAALAVTRNSRTVASLTLAGALVTPLLLEPTSAHPLFFPYLAFVNIGAAVVRLRKSWPGLVLAAFLATAILVVAWWARFFSFDTRTQALAGVTSLWAVYLAIPYLARSSVPVWRLAGSALVLANSAAAALFLWAWLGELAFLRGVAIAALALLYALVGRLRIRPELGAVHELAALGLGALAIPIHYDLETVTVGWALLAVILVHLGLVRSSLPHRVLGYLVLAASLGHHILFDVAATEPGLFGATETGGPQWVAGLTATAAILAVAGLLRRADRRPGGNLAGPEKAAGTPLVLVAAGFLLYVLSVQVWRGLEAHGARRAQLGLSFTWALYGCLLIAIGFVARFRPLRLAGVGLLLALVLKLFTFDMSVLERGERIASFVGVGVLLLIVSLLYQRRRRKESPGEDDEREPQ